jgi:hypothetical protein
MGYSLHSNTTPLTCNVKNTLENLLRIEDYFFFLLFFAAPFLGVRIFLNRLSGRDLLPE